MECGGGFGGCGRGRAECVRESVAVALGVGVGRGGRGAEEGEVPSEVFVVRQGAPDGARVGAGAGRGR